MKKRDGSRAGWTEWLCFTAYLGFLLYLVFFAEQFGRADSDRVYRYNLVPFREISRYIRHFRALGIYSVINLAGNVAVFVPFGMWLPILAAPARKGYHLVFYTFLLSLMIESVQLLFRVGSFDVDDIFLNTLGGLIGFILYYLLNRGAEKKSDSGAEQKQQNGRTL